MKEELYTYLKEWDCYPEVVEHFLDCFFENYQPERSKREDSWRDRSMTNSQYEQFIKDTNEYMRCGALNTEETQ